MTHHASPPAAPPDVDAADEMWRRYSAAHPQFEAAERPVVEPFGDSASMADELVHLVMHGAKRATAGLVTEYAEEGSPLPRIGGHWIICDGGGSPRVIVRTTELRIGDFDSVDAAFAWDEGENDRSLDGWRSAHRSFWERTRAARGEVFDTASEIVFERFRIVWPPEYAD